MSGQPEEGSAGNSKSALGAMSQKLDRLNHCLSQAHERIQQTLSRFNGPAPKVDVFLCHPLSEPVGMRDTLALQIDDARTRVQTILQLVSQLEEVM